MIYSDVPVKCAYVFGGWDGNKLLKNNLWMWLVEGSEWRRLRTPEELIEEAKEAAAEEESK